jgi:hypothetical protein
MNVIRCYLIFPYLNTALIVYIAQRRDVVINIIKIYAKWSVTTAKITIKKRMTMLNLVLKLYNYYMENMAYINDAFLNLFACILCLVWIITEYHYLVYLLLFQWADFIVGSFLLKIWSIQKILLSYWCWNGKLWTECFTWNNY